MLVETPANTPPPDAVAGQLTTPDDVKLRFARWLTTSSKRKGTICLLQGRAEYIEKYFETIRQLRARGFAVATFDWRGQGGSQRLLPNAHKGHARRFGDYVVDLRAVMEQVVLPDCPPPYYVLAHSMGSLIAFLAEPTCRSWFDRMVLLAPLFGLGSMFAPVGLSQTTLKAMGILPALRRVYVPGAGDTPNDIQPFIGNPLTSDPLRFSRNASVIEAAPRLGLGGPTIGWARAAFAAMETANAPGYAQRIAVPMLLVAAGADRVVSNTAVERVAQPLRAGAHIVLSGAQHEILQERDMYREQFLAAFDAFIPGTPIYS